MTIEEFKDKLQAILTDLDEMEYCDAAFPHKSKIREANELLTEIEDIMFPVE